MTNTNRTDHRHALPLLAMLDALSEGQKFEPRGLSCELLAWELDEREATVAPLLAQAHTRALVERSGINRQGQVLWRLTERGAEYAAAMDDSPRERGTPRLAPGDQPS